VYPDNEVYAEEPPHWKSDDYEVREQGFCDRCQSPIVPHYGEPLASCDCLEDVEWVDMGGVAMKKVINKKELKDLILDGITSEELNSLYDYSGITDFSYTFANCKSLESIPKLDTSNGVNFSYMFSKCKSLKSIPKLNTSSGTHFSYMFSNCTSLESIPKLDTSNGVNFSYMFANCKSLKVIPELDTRKSRFL
jgi:hypothetical protein